MAKVVRFVPVTHIGYPCMRVEIFGKEAEPGIKINLELNILYENYLVVFHVVLFVVLYKVVLTMKSVDETLVVDHSNESCKAVF